MQFEIGSHAGDPHLYALRPPTPPSSYLPEPDPLKQVKQVKQRAPRASASQSSVLALATLSGAAALIYEVVFFRSLGLMFGVATYTAAAVVASFLGGLGLGAWLGGRLPESVRALRQYAILEFLTALFGFASPWLFRAAGGLVEPPAGDHGFPFGTFLLAFLLLLWPTLMMGATFPVLGRAIAGRSNQVARRIGQLYGWNTAGAVLGTLGAAYLFLPELGLFGTTLLAAGLNLLLGLWALWLSGGVPAPAVVLSHRDAPSGNALPQGEGKAAPLALLFGCVALIGCATIALQILANRLLVSLLGGSVYAFASVLAMFLLGIALGGALGGGFVARRPRPLTALAQACWLVAGGIGLGLLLLRLRLGLTDPLRGARNLSLLTQDPSLLDFLGVSTLLSALTLLPATLLSGAVLPAVSHWFQNAPGLLSRRLGALYGASTIGSVLGSLVAVSVLLPLCGLRVSLWLIALLAVAAGLLPFIAARAAGERPSSGMGLLSLPAALLLLYLGLRPGDPSAGEAGVREIFYTESPASSVRVIEVLEQGEPRPVRCLFVNGKPVATSLLIDQRLQLLLGFIPTLIHPRPERILSIALGTGMSSGALAVSGARSVEIVELSSGVIAAAPLFDDWNAEVLRQPNVTLYNDDGRAFLARSDERYDLISADPIHPWVAGSAFLFTREYYSLAREHLLPGGLMSQWIPLYELTTEDIGGIVLTFSEVFPEVSAWVTGYDLVLLGSLEPLAIDVEQVRERMAREPTRSMLRNIGVSEAADLLGCWFAGRPTLDRLAGRAPRPITDDRPWIEFTAPRSALRSGYALEVLTLLAEASDEPPFAVDVSARDLEAIRASRQRLREAALSFVKTIWTTGRQGAARNAYSAELQR